MSVYIQRLQSTLSSAPELSRKLLLEGDRSPRVKFQRRLSNWMLLMHVNHPKIGISILIIRQGNANRN